MKTLSPSSITRLYVPKKCDLRAWLRANTEVKEAPDSPFQIFLQDQGIRHEARVLERLKVEFPDCVDLDGFNSPDATAETEKEIKSGTSLIYQGKFEVVTKDLTGDPLRIIGYPDFLIKKDNGYVIADAKLARSILEEKSNGSFASKSGKKHILLQLQLYGWLFHNQFPDLDFDLVVYNGGGGVEPIAFDDRGVEAIDELKRLLAIEGKATEPPEPVGWSKCGACGFFNHCWPRAEEAKALGFVPELDQNLVCKLWREGINTYPELAAGMDATQLADLKNKSVGSKDPKVLAGAGRILENVRALMTGTPIQRRKMSGELVPLESSIRDGKNFVMFDLEGVPPEQGEFEKIYLWGMQVFGTEPGEFRPAFAEFGEGGDQQGWDEFLRIARELLDQHPGIRFVHWAPYEKTKIESYIERYPESDLTTAGEVLESLLDLWPITREVVALPLPSYSLKVVEQLPQLVEVTGFSRSAEDVKKGDDSIVAYMEAVETGDGSRREKIVAQLAAYNQEDLEATWAVQSWLMHLVELDGLSETEGELRH